MDLIPRLSLNKQPKDCTNLSFVNARNIRISDEGTTIINEESLEINSVIANEIVNKLISNYRIIHIIPCNDELVIFVGKTKGTNKSLYIFRYNEKNNKCILVKSNLPSDNDNTKCKISGDFTYNVDNALIITYCVYDGVIDLPMCTLNLGEWNDVYNNINDFSKCKISNDLLLSNDKISIVPEVKIPSFTKVEFTSGRTYKGWYQFYIRYKISEYNYTQWYNFGYPIHNTSLQNTAILKYCYGKSPIMITKANDDNFRFLNGYCTGFSDYINDDLDISLNDIKLTLNDKNNFVEYQIGCIICTKSYTKAFRTDDIKSNNKTVILSSINIDADANEFNIEYYNYNNVKNIVNYKNRLYISNYKESNINEDLQEYTTNNVDLQLHIEGNNLLDCLTNEIGVVTFQKTNKALISETGDKLCKDGYPPDATIVLTEDQISNVNEGQLNSILLKDFLKIRDDITVELTCSDGTTEFDINKLIVITTITNRSIRRFDIAWRRDDNSLGKSSNYLKDETYIITYNNNPILVIEASDSTKSPSIPYPTNTISYIDTNKTFNIRQSKSTLIPGEVYNFYIHYVDKYGHATNGYKITNKNKILIDNVEKEGNILHIQNTIGQFIDNFYVYIPKNAKIINKNNKLGIHFKVNDDTSVLDDDTTVVYIYTNITFENNIIKLNSSDIFNEHDLGNTSKYMTFINKFNERFDYILNNNFKNHTWDEILDDWCNDRFLSYWNKNDNKLFKVPNIPISLYNIGLKVKIPVIPEGYIGYFISYEKPEQIKRFKGILTKYDFIKDNYIIDEYKYKSDDDVQQQVNVYNLSNFSKSDKMLFFSDELNISDSLKLDCNYIKLLQVNSFKNLENRDSFDSYPAKTFKYPHDLNVPQNKAENDLNKLIYINNLKLNVADSLKDSRQGLGTCLSMDIANDLFINNYYDNYPSVSTNKVKESTNIYLCELICSTKDLYLNDKKDLVRCSDIIYNLEGVITNDYIVIHNYFNGYNTYGSAIIYNNDGVVFNTADNTARRFADNSLYFDPSHIGFWKNNDEDNADNFPLNKDDFPSYRTERNRNFDFVKYFQYLDCKEYFHEDKSFQNNPQNIIYLTAYDTTVADEKANPLATKPLQNGYAPGSMVTPANSVDLFQNKIGSISQYTQKHYFNYDEDLINVTEFNKTIRRSAVIADESRENAWRKFAIEGYKNITENKGKITRLTGIGTLLLVHCEHSLFMFDVDNSLSTVDKQIQLYSPDTFEVQYKEIFTSNLGFGGLQDKDSAIVDEFGYIFYDTDKSVFYRYDAGKLNIMSSDIQLWLNKFKPTNIRYANDKKHNRLLISLDYLDENVVLSYNYRANSFISIHDHVFTNGYNTKNKLYIVHDYTQMFNGTQLTSFISNFNNYYNTTFGKSTNQVKTTTSSISIIINPEYTINKFLEHIKYSFNKIDVNKENDQVIFPVEGIGIIDTAYDNPIVEPYSGFAIRVFNNQCNTGTLNILVDNELTKNAVMDYNKPHWLLGSWTFNYLRNVVKLKGINTIADKMSRMFGNYFIVEFVFNDASKKENNYRYEFEDFDCKLSKDKIG